jgi:hypothetical protein
MYSKELVTSMRVGMTPVEAAARLRKPNSMLELFFLLSVLYFRTSAIAEIMLEVEEEAGTGSCRFPSR